MCLPWRKYERTATAFGSTTRRKYERTRTGNPVFGWMRVYSLTECLASVVEAAGGLSRPSARTKAAGDKLAATSRAVKPRGTEDRRKNLKNCSGLVNCQTSCSY